MFSYFRQKKETSSMDGLDFREGKDPGTAELLALRPSQ